MSDRRVAEDATSMMPAVPSQPAGPAGSRTHRALPALSDGAKTSVWVATHGIPSELDERLILLREPDSARAAAFRVLRQRLAERGDPRVIAVTSPGRKEGKTTVAANLALALSECGRSKVLFVEGNFRNPQLASLFGFIPPECFTAQLDRHRDKPLDPWAVVEVYSPFLHVIAIHPRTEPRPLVDAPAFGAAMDRFRACGYDFIVVDTPAVLGQADVNLIEDSCDSLLLTGIAGHASARQITRAVDQLAPAKIAGIALLNP